MLISTTTTIINNNNGVENIIVSPSAALSVLSFVGAPDKASAENSFAVGGGIACSSTALVSAASSSSYRQNNYTSINIPAINQLAEELAKAVKNRKRNVRSIKTEIASRNLRSAQEPEEKRRKMKNATEEEVVGSGVEQDLVKPAFHYKLQKRIDDGAFSYVYQIDNHEACKIIPLRYANDSDAQHQKRLLQIKNESRIHQSLSHENIVEFHRVIQGKENMYIMMEYCAGGNLHTLVKKKGLLDKDIVAAYLLQIVQALKYLHEEQKIIHRDLKLANIFLSADHKQLKIGDFGLAIDSLHCKTKNDLAGTPNYLAPEIANGSGNYTPAVDVWSFGIVAFILLCGRAPFSSKTIEETYKRIAENKPVFKPSDQMRLGEEAMDLLKSILQSKAEQRLSLNQIENHAFFALYRE
jgi:serine/threonine protein kinase